MTKRILSVVADGYRAAAEEQDDTIVWINTVLASEGGQVSVLLRGSCVHYLQGAATAPALRFGEWRQTQPPDISGDLQRMLDKGVKLYYLAEDAEALGVEVAPTLAAAQPIADKELTKLFEDHDLLFHW